MTKTAGELDAYHSNAGQQTISHPIDFPNPVVRSDIG